MLCIPTAGLFFLSQLSIFAFFASCRVLLASGQCLPQITEAFFLKFLQEMRRGNLLIKNNPKGLTWNEHHLNDPVTICSLIK